MQRMVGRRGVGPKEQDASERMGPARRKAGLTGPEDAADCGVHLQQKDEWVEAGLEAGSARGTRVLLPLLCLQCRSWQCPVDSSRTNPLWVGEAGEEACPAADRLKPMPREL